MDSDGVNTVVVALVKVNGGPRTEYVAAATFADLASTLSDRGCHRIVATFVGTEAPCAELRERLDAIESAREAGRNRARYLREQSRKLAHALRETETQLANIVAALMAGTLGHEEFGRTYASLHETRLTLRRDDAAIDREIEKLENA